jgi:hypothetical protein
MSTLNTSCVFTMLSQAAFYDNYSGTWRVI